MAQNIFKGNNTIGYKKIKKQMRNLIKIANKKTNLELY